MRSMSIEMRAELAAAAMSGGDADKNQQPQEHLKQIYKQRSPLYVKTLSDPALSKC